MNKHDVFQFTAPNGVEVAAVCIDCISNTLREYDDHLCCKYLCYAQNRLFTYFVEYCQEPVAIDQDEFGDDVFDYQTVVVESSYGEVIVDYAILPDFDEQLRKFTLNEEIMDTFSPEDYNNDDNLDSQQYNS